VSDACCWGIFREVTHSPGRESDDAEILRLTGKHLETRGFQVVLKSPDEVIGATEPPPSGIFLMCERLDILKYLRTLEIAGVAHVNSPVAVLNTYRERMIAQCAEANVPFVHSQLVSTSGAWKPTTLPVWVKRADVHNTQDGDVVFGETAQQVREALDALAARGIGRAVIQPHLEGDLVKFYGVGTAPRGGGVPPWARWFYHMDQTVAGHPFDANQLIRTVQRAAVALGLEVYGGDAIVTSTGQVLILDVNAWPSFALYRDEAAERIAVHLTQRFGRGQV
jgi:hypothetical protein